MTVKVNYFEMVIFVMRERDTLLSNYEHMTINSAHLATFPCYRYCHNQLNMYWTLYMGNIVIGIVTTN